MASCITAQWVSTAPQMQLDVSVSGSSNETTAVLAYTLYYKASYPAESVARPYSIVINGSTVKSGSFAINGKTGTHTVTSGTVSIAKGTAAKSIPFSVTVDWSLTWSGVYKGSVSASSSISVAAKTSYTVSYNANGGSGAPGAQTKWYGTNLTLSSAKPTRTGYTFQGWATSSSGSVAYAAGGTYSANAPVTLYAKWQAITYAVTYNANGGSGAPGNQTKTYGVTLTLSSTKPTKTNYNFLGWGTSASATTVAYAAGANYTANAALNLYAIWELAYIVPRITNLSATRCDASGNLKEDGTCTKVSFGWATDRTVSSVKIEWKLTTATTWGNSATVTASGTSGNVAQVVGSSALSTDNTYNFRVTVTDSGGSSSATTVVGGLAYTIDFKAGGKGAAFGKPAETDNLLEVDWDAAINGNLTMRNTDNIYMQNNAGVERNALHMNASNNLNLGYGGYRAAEGQTNVYGDKVNLLHSNGLMINNTAVGDFVVEQGTSSIWTYRKWNSGIAECWGRTSVYTVDVVSTWGPICTCDNAIPSINYPFTFKSLPTVVATPEINNYNYWFYTSSSLTPRTDKSPGFSILRATTSSGVKVQANIHVTGRWK